MEYEKIKIGSQYNFFMRDARTSEKVLTLKVTEITPFEEISDRILRLFQLENANEYFKEDFWLIERPTFIIKAKLLLEGERKSLLFAENKMQQLQCFGNFFWNGFLDYDNSLLNKYINSIETERLSYLEKIERLNKRIITPKIIPYTEKKF